MLKAAVFTLCSTLQPSCNKSYRILIAFKTRIIYTILSGKTPLLHHPNPDQVVRNQQSNKL